MTGNANGVTEFELPNQWAGRDDLLKGIKDFSVTGGELNDSAKADEAVEIRRVTHAPGALLTIQYRLVRIGNAYPESHREAFSPVLEPTYFHVIGTGAWVVPRAARDEKFLISLKWEMPKDWAIANSFGAGAEIRAGAQRITTTLGAFRHGLYIGGDFRIATFTVKNYPVLVALRGEWGFFDENFADLAKRIVDVERGFWPDYQYPHYLISAIPIGKAPPSGSYYAGTGLENAFALFLAPNTQVKELRALLVHELWHNWNAPKFGGLKEPQPLLYWWSEGVTDFYTQRLLLQSGLYTPQEFIKSYNDVLRAYTQSNARNAPNSRINDEFWKNAEVGRLPYQRGQLFAARLDREIQRASNGRYSLDDVMRDLLKSSAKNSSKPLDTETLNAHIAQRLGRSYAAEMNRFIEQGETIDLASDDLGRCFARHDVQLRPYEEGFDAGASFEAKKVVGVVENSAAYLAGLRDGMPLSGWSIYRGDATKPVELNTSVGAKPVTIEFLPVAQNAITVPQFEMKKDLDQAALKHCDH